MGVERQRKIHKLKTIFQRSDPDGKGWNDVSDESRIGPRRSIAFLGSVEQLHSRHKPCSRCYEQLASHPWFDKFFMVCILANCVVMATEHYQQSDALTEFQQIASVILTFLFTLELTVKLLGTPPHVFWHDFFDIFDVLLVIISLVELIVTVVETGSLFGDKSAISVFRALRILRMMRVLRVLKVIEYLKPLRSLLDVVFRAMGSLTWIYCLISLFLFIFALVGMNLFGPSQSRDSRFNFDNVGHAMLTTFYLLCSYNWTTPVYDVVGSTSIYSTIFFVGFIIVVVFLVTELILVVVLESFKNAQAREENAVFESQDQHLFHHTDTTVDVSEDDQETSETRHRLQVLHGKSLLCFGPDSHFRRLCARLVTSVWFDYVVIALVLLNSIVMAAEGPSDSSENRNATVWYWLDITFAMIFTLEVIHTLFCVSMVLRARTVA